MTAAATVVIFPADRAGWQPKSPHVLSVQTDRQGGYALKNVPPGEYRVAAATLAPDVWLDAETLSGLLDRSIAAQVELAGSLNIYLAVP